MSSISITDVKACRVSDDGAQFTLTLATKYVGDMNIVMPIACREQIIAALTQVSANNGVQAQKPVQVSVDKSGSQAQKSVAVRVPKKWMVTADAERHGVVLVIFDPQTPAQSAYALKPDPAKQFALGITKSAEALLARNVDPATGA